MRSTHTLDQSVTLSHPDLLSTMSRLSFSSPLPLRENNPENGNRVCLSLNGDPALNDDSI